MAPVTNNHNTFRRADQEQRSILNECADCIQSLPQPLDEKGKRFLAYFEEHATREGVLFKTIRELTTDLHMPHQTLTKVLKELEDRELIYRRNGIIGLWRK